MQKIEKISVLLSIYFKENEIYLDEAFKSLAIQKTMIDEVVAVIDGPISNGLWRVVRKWDRELPLKIVELNENVGLGKALNAGLQACSNDLVARMDTDDICLPERFEKQIKMFIRNPELVIIGGAVDEFTEKNNIRKLKKVPCGYDNISKTIAKRNPFNHMTVMFRKQKIIEIGGYKHHYLMEDYNLWLRCYAAGFAMDNVNDVLVLARTGEEMINRRKGLKYIKSEYELYKLIVDLGINKGVSAKLIFLGRSLVRLLPKRLLSSIYNQLLRK